MHQHEHSTVIERQTSQVKPPGRYSVSLLNDDYTTQEFVVEVLMLYFNKSEAEATAIMHHVHNAGRGVCGVYTKDVAETKVECVIEEARRQGHPLQCLMEEV